MDIRSQIVRFRNSQRKKVKKNPLRRIGLSFALLFSLITAILIIVGIYRYSAITGNLPSPVKLENLIDSPTASLLKPTRVYDKTGQNIIWWFENPSIDYRSNVRITDGNMLFYSDVEEITVSAILTAIDPVYFSRSDSFMENLWDNSLDPIPQSLVGELLLWDELEHPYQLLRLNLLADQIVGKYGRLKILEWYLNSAYFGNQIYGVHQAARIYFGKEAVLLNTAESALLAAVVKYPSLNPYDAPTAAKENQEEILLELVTAGILTQGEGEIASQYELVYADPESSISPSPPAYVEYMLDEADDYIPRERLLRGGFNIISTLDTNIQKELECTAEISLNQVYGENQGLEESCLASKLLPRYSGKELSIQEKLEINVVILDPQSGELLAMVGVSRGDTPGRLFEPKLAGSIITPFIYLTSFTQGFEPASLVWDVPVSEYDLTSDELHPGCLEDCGFQGPVNMRTAIGNDYLSPALQLWTSFGSNRVNNTLALFGFSILEGSCPECVLFPELSKVEIIDIAQGFGIIANQGILKGRSITEGGLESKPKSVLRIEEIPNDGGFFSLAVEEKTVIGDQLAYLINHVLSDEGARSNIAGDDVYQIGRPAAIKTGYVSGSSSGWVVGYTPQFVTVVWSGIHDDVDLSSSDIQQINSGVWRAITQYINRDYAVENWQLPNGMETLEVCYPSGMLPTDFCPKIIREPFIVGNDPLEYDSLYQVFEVNRETGLLASVFTPSDMIEERVYLAIPEVAVDWSLEAGIENPPKIYDLNISDIAGDGLSISSPDNFSSVRGIVSIVGSIPEDEFISSRLQVGEGMNPRSWLQVGPDIVSPVSNMLLTKWDTTNLDDGIYALQLVLIRESRQVDNVSLVLSVDNTPPDITLITDYNNQQIPYEVGKEMLFQLENNPEIKKVDVYMDSKLLSSRNTPPYAFPWLIRLGDHDLRIVAFDQANNRGELSISFQVVIPD